jgi:hypothetical protein
MGGLTKRVNETMPAWIRVDIARSDRGLNGLIGETLFAERRWVVTVGCTLIRRQIGQPGTRRPSSAPASIGVGPLSCCGQPLSNSRERLKVGSPIEYI